MGLRVASEVFADRRYEDDGQLVSRKPDATITTDEAIQQALKMVLENKVVKWKNYRFESRYNLCSWRW